MTSEMPTGVRFSNVYMVPPNLLQDSIRMKRRLGILIFQFAGNVRERLNAELGTALPAAASGTADYWPAYFSKLELKDALDAITVSIQKVRSEHWSDFLDEVARIFNEEHVGYRVDAKGGVHFRVDTEFERVRTSAVGSISGSRYDSVRDQFDRAYKALDGVPPDGKLAVRCAFFALEALFRLIFPNAHQLSANEVGKNLKPLVDRTLANEKPALQVASKQLEAFKDWIDGAHFYRHEPGTEEPAQPPLDMAVLIVSQAGAYLRWLRHFDGVR
ncbi:hypothetical protein FB004_103494 [Sinorhizobium medicae]|uniref:hypothetical protein n=1 Tax=Sinorhizobium medicae TaxID=110321 RepID=UPI0011A0011B|nr:hypothetical protein [Sinorhizobium medicae]TWA26388.1 hypothetical protein FB004_103494 [Sinorhizobium medicae]